MPVKDYIFYKNSFPRMLFVILGYSWNDFPRIVRPVFDTTSDFPLQ